MSIPILNLPPRRKTPSQLFAEGLSATAAGAAEGIQENLQEFLDLRKREATFAQAKEKEVQKAKAQIGTTIDRELNALGIKDVDPEIRLRLSNEALEDLVRTGDPLAAHNKARQFAAEQIAKDQEEQEEKTEGFLEGIKKVAKGRRTQLREAILENPILGPLEKSFTRGLTQQTAAAAIAGNQESAEELSAQAIVNPSFAEELAGDLGVLAGDLPFMLIGGGIAGPGGALALPAFLKAAANEIWDGLRSDQKLTLKRGGEAAARVAANTAKGFLTGESLRLIPGLNAAIKRIPGAKKFLDNFMAEKVLEVAGTTTAFAAVPAGLEARVPTARDFTSALALTLGFEAAKLPRSLQENIETKALKTALTPQEFAAEVADEVSKQNINIEKVEAGDGKETQKFNRVINQVSAESPVQELQKARRAQERVEKPGISTEKLKEAEAAEKKTVKLAAKSPLEVYFEPVEEPKRESTRERRREQASELTRQQTFAKQKLKKDNVKVLELESDLRQAEPGKREAIQDKLDKAIETRQKQRDILDDIEFRQRELAKNRVSEGRPTEEGIAKQIDTSFERIINEIQDPESVDTKKVARQALQDKEAIDLGNKLLKRGDLLSQPEVDTFIRLKEQYRQAYEEMIRANEKIADKFESSKDPAERKIAQEAKAMNERLKKAVRRQKADIVKQRDKKAIQKLTRGARGAFFRNKLKTLRQDIVDFQKDFFKQTKLKERTKQQTKTEQVSQESIKKFQKDLETFAEQPKSEKGKASAEKIAEATGQSKETINEGVEQTSKAFEETKAKAEKGTLTEKDVKKTAQTAFNWLKDKVTGKKVKAFKERITRNNEKIKKLEKKLAKTKAILVKKDLSQDIAELKSENSKLRKAQVNEQLKNSVMLGVMSFGIQKAVEKATGIKLGLRGSLALGGFVTTGGTLVPGARAVGLVVSLINQGVNLAINKIETERFKTVLKTKNPITIKRHRQSLQNRYSAGRVRTIEKNAKPKRRQTL